MTIEIRIRYGSTEVLFASVTAATTREAVVEAVAAGANLAEDQEVQP